MLHWIPNFDYARKEHLKIFAHTSEKLLKLLKIEFFKLEFYAGRIKSKKKKI